MPEDEALASLRQARVLHSFGLSVGRWRSNHTADRRRSSVTAMEAVRVMAPCPTHALNTT